MTRLPPKHALSGRYLNRRWEVGAEHPLYHRKGTWWEVLTDFPAALFGPWGYVLFETEEEYENSRYLDIASKTNLNRDLVDHLSEIPGYIAVEEGEWWSR